MADVRNTTAEECQILAVVSQDHKFLDISTTPYTMTIPGKPGLVAIIYSWQFKCSKSTFTLTFTSTGKDTVIWRQAALIQLNPQGFPYFVGGSGADINIVLGNFGSPDPTQAELLVGFYYGPAKTL